MTAPQPFPRGRRAQFYTDVPDDKWFDWRWQMSNRLNTVGELARVLDLNDSERQALEAKDLFRVDVTPYFASLIDAHDPHDPIRQQIIPTARELAPFASMMEDSLAEEGEADVVVVLVAVADDERLGVLVEGEGDHELGLGAGFEAEVVVLAGVEDLLDDLAELVDLDGEDAAVFTLVGLLGDGLAEGFVEVDDAVAEQVLEADDHGGLQAHAERLFHDVHDADGTAVAQRLDGDLAIGIDLVMAGTPAFEAVEILGFIDGPGGRGLGFQGLS